MSSELVIVDCFQVVAPHKDSVSGQSFAMPVGPADGKQGTTRRDSNARRISAIFR